MPGQKAIFLPPLGGWAYADELSYEEIAKATHVNAATLRSRVFYALRALRGVLQKE